MEKNFKTKKDGVTMEVNPCTVEITNANGKHKSEMISVVIQEVTGKELSIELTKDEALRLSGVLLELSK